MTVEEDREKKRFGAVRQSPPEHNGSHVVVAVLTKPTILNLDQPSWTWTFRLSVSGLQYLSREPIAAYILQLKSQNGAEFSLLEAAILSK